MSDWLDQPLGSLANFQKGRKVETSEHPREGFAPYLGASAISGVVQEYGDTRTGVMSAPGDVLMLWDGERSGLVGKARSGVISSTVARLSPGTDIEGEYLYYALDSKFEWIQGRRTGTGVPHVPKDLARILSISYPKSKNEQRRITEILSTLDEAITQTEALIAKHQQIKAGLMHDLFTRGVTPDGHLRPIREQTPDLYKESPLGWIPKEWEVGELRRWLSYLSYGFTNPMPESDEGPYMVTAADINGGRIQYDTCRKTTRNAFDHLLTQKSRPKVGDVLLTKDGTLGRIAVVDRTDVCINQSVAVLRPIDARHSQFIAAMLGAPMWQQKMLSDAGGSTIKHIYITVVDKMLVAWPSRPDELEVISGRIEESIAMTECEEVNLDKLRQQKHGLMHDLLTGTVRVKIEQASAGSADG